VAAEPFDLLLMDCEMPVMDGFQATRALRALETEQARNRLPVIALTANAMTGDRERCIAAGMDDYISKPIKLGQLQQTLARWLPGADGGEQGELGSAGGPGSGEEPPIEPGNLKVLGELMGDGFLRFLDRFEDRSSELVESIAECIARDAPEELRRAAYHLKVSAGHLGAGRIYALAQRLESLAQEGRLAEAEASLGTLRLEHVRALAAIADLRAPLLAQGEG
jgi:YesN/AraC family two-component response regulator